MTLGLALAARRLGKAVDIPLALDVDPDAVGVFTANFPTARARCENVETYFDGQLGASLTHAERRTAALVGSIDALIGGPPCQGNSDLNNHTRRDDPRNQLYGRMARAAEVLQPRLIVVENVPAVVHDRENIVEVTRAHLASLGYVVSAGIVPLVRLGVPQYRKRHLLLAVKEVDCELESILSGVREAEVRQRSVQWAIRDLLQLRPITDFDKPSVTSDENRRRMAWLFTHDAYELPNRLRPACHRDKVHTYKSVYGRMHWDRPAQTITTGFGSMGQGCYVHPRRPRTITPHEAARLQTFPDFFRFDLVSKRGAWSSLIGNAVPPFLTLYLGGILLPLLNRTTGAGKADRRSQLHLKFGALTAVGGA
jgi:DNA (cytosine-5)-methyltransferase 1